MARRDISHDLLRVCFGAVRKTATPSKLLSMVLEEMASAQRDLDKTGDIDMAHYYTGVVDTLHWMALAIAPLKDDKRDSYFGLLDMIVTPITEENAA